MSGTQILVVEDENIVAKDIQNRLRRFGYVVTGTASSGEEALEKALEATPDLVLMDIMLKGEMDGTEAAERMRARFNVPVVYLTAYADDHTLQRAKVTGPFGYILKPFEEKELRTTIEMALYKHRAERALERARDELEVRVEERTADLQAANAQLRREIEERKRAEEALRRSEAQLRQAQKMEAVGRLAGGLAHDFNNQLAIIRGYAEMAIADLPEGTSAYKDLLEISEVVRKGSHLTDQLLLFSSRQPLDRRPVDLNRQVADLKRMLGRLLGEDVSIALRLAEDLWTVKADTMALDQAVTNLAVNARDAMPEGGTLGIEIENVTVDEATCRQHLEARPGRFVRLRVSDTGMGMDAEVMSHLFEPFFTTKAPGRGTGLGLSIVYGIVQSHEGWIAVESRPGEGSLFEIYLPALNPGEGHAREAGRPAARCSPEGQGERVLLVEDERGVREMLKKMLERRGYSVCTCTTVTEAREVLREGQGHFDLILSDVVLPDGRGPDLVLEALEAEPGLGAVMMTGYLDERGDRERIREAGLALLQKPVEMAELLARVREALGKREVGQ